MLSHNGQPPLEVDRGWKDTVTVTAALPAKLNDIDFYTSDDKRIDSAGDEL